MKNAERKPNFNTKLFKLWGSKTDSAAFICDAVTGNVLEIFGPCAKWFNCGPEELPFRIAQLMSSQDVGPDNKKVMAALNKSVSVGSPRGEWSIVDASGKLRSICLDLAIIKDGKSPKLVGFVKDVTENRQLLRYLKTGMEYETIGKVADRMAHDFNNCMQAIMGHAHIISMEMMEEKEQEESLDEIRYAAEKAGYLAQQLLVFRRLRKLSKSVFSLNSLVEGIVPVVTQALGPEVDLNIELSDSPCLIEADKGQIDQVLLNLVFNARDSLPDGEGNITIRTRVIPLNSDWRKEYPWTVSGDYVSLVVKDTGPGMSQETLKMACEPFFTSREPAPGKGLGLSSVEAIIMHHLGVFKLVSKPEIGTTASVYLKRVQV